MHFFASIDVASLLKDGNRSSRASLYTFSRMRGLAVRLRRKTVVRYTRNILPSLNMRIITNRFGEKAAFLDGLRRISMTGVRRHFITLPTECY